MKISPPAFPTWITDDSMAHGMSLRDYFASQVLSEVTRIGVLVEYELSEKQIATDCNICYRIADAMMKEREK
jgi:hypothetical protein